MVPFAVPQSIGMDKFLFDQHLQDCTIVQEKTTCFETFLYADPEYRTTVTEETILEVEEFDDFLDQKGRFKNKNQGCIGGIRLMQEFSACSTIRNFLFTNGNSLQGNAIHPNTFEPKFLSLPDGFHKKIVSAMHLPHSWIETLSAVGLFYWSGYEHNDNGLYLREWSNVENASDARSWELVLSYSLKTGITNAFFKGTPRADSFLVTLISEKMKVADTIESESKSCKKYVADASHRYADPDFTKLDNVNFFQLNSDLVDCHDNVSWKRLEGHATVVQEMQKTLFDFKPLWPDERKERLRKIQAMIGGRLRLLQSRLQGTRAHREITISRLKLIGEMLERMFSLDFYRQERQRQLEIFYARRKERLEEVKNTEFEAKQGVHRELGMRETRKQTIISLTGVLFLPATFFAVGWIETQLFACLRYPNATW
ncbi:hypothetical protein EAF00_005312 [Botryotinia globosa]|nr:hypothetical protein EAF00_005312 [Botryotinia globosa]